ncbi:hypothetical protein SDC9_87488 [bioreactor metagenome]|uniref:Uncharacterized protein n=1 Tax=bioreactor metagenome TaxID=1076179 RepID=A0A644ZIY3_9ZZZZ
MHRSHRLHHASKLTRSIERKRAVGENSAWQSAHKIENTCFGPLVLAKSFVIHKQIHHFFARINFVEPSDKLIGCQRPAFPALLRETECNVVAQPEILQKKFQTRILSIAIKIIRAFPTQHVLGAFSEHNIIAHAINHVADFVGINQLSITKSSTLITYQIIQQLLLTFHLCTEFLFVAQCSQRMAVRFCQKLHTAGVGKSSVAVNYLGCIFGKLLKSHP